MPRCCASGKDKESVTCLVVGLVYFVLLTIFFGPVLVLAIRGPARSLDTSSPNSNCQLEETVNVSPSHPSTLFVYPDVDPGTTFWVCISPETEHSASAPSRYSVSAQNLAQNNPCITYEDISWQDSDGCNLLSPTGAPTADISFCNDWTRSFRVGISFPNSTTTESASVVVVFTPLPDADACVTNVVLLVVLCATPFVVAILAVGCCAAHLRYENPRRTTPCGDPFDHTSVSVVSSGGGMRAMTIFQGLMAYLFCKLANENEAEYTIHNIMTAVERDGFVASTAEPRFTTWTSTGRKPRNNGVRFHIRGFSAVSGSTYALSSFLSFLGPTAGTALERLKAYKDMVKQCRDRSDVFLEGGFFYFILRPILAGTVLGVFLVAFQMLFAAMAQFSLCTCGDDTICTAWGIVGCPNVLLPACQTGFKSLYWMTSYFVNPALLVFLVVRTASKGSSKLQRHCPPAILRFFTSIPLSATCIKLLIIVPLWDTLVATRWFVQWMFQATECLDGGWWDISSVFHWSSFVVFLAIVFVSQFQPRSTFSKPIQAGMILAGIVIIEVLLLVTSLCAFFLISTVPLTVGPMLGIEAGVVAAMLFVDMCSYYASYLPHHLYVGPIVTNFWKRKSQNYRLNDFAASPLAPLYFNAASHDVTDRGGTSSSVALSPITSSAHIPYFRVPHSNRLGHSSDVEMHDMTESHLACGHCDRRFFTREELQRHVVRAHGQSAAFKSSTLPHPYLSKDFDTPRSLLLSEAVAASGAAVASDMGSKHNVPIALRFVMSLFSFNMGVWVKLQESYSSKWDRLLAGHSVTMQLGLMLFYPMVLSTLLASDRLMDGTLTVPEGNGMDVSTKMCMYALAITLLVYAVAWLSMRIWGLDQWMLNFSPFYRRIKQATLTGTYHSCRVKHCTDGGHVDNLGLLPIILDERPEKKIIALDSGYDRENTQEGLSESLRMIQHYCANMGENVSFEYQVLRPPSDLVPSTIYRRHEDGSFREEGSFARETCNVITWSIVQVQDGVSKDLKWGEIFYLRSVYSYNFSNYLELFRLSDPELPHRPTTDPAYAMHEYEVYLRFGAHLMKTNEAAFNEFLLYRKPRADDPDDPPPESFPDEPHPEPVVEGVGVL